MSQNNISFDGLRNKGDLARWMQGAVNQEAHKIKGKLKPSQIKLGAYNATAAVTTTLTTSEQLVAAIVVDPGTYIVWASVTFDVTGSGVGVCRGKVKIDGATNVFLPCTYKPATTGAATVGRTWTVATNGSLALVADKTIAAGAADALSGLSLTALRTS